MTTLQEALIARRTGKDVPEHAGDYWSKEEIETIKNLYHDGVGISEMAITLGRTESAVFQQIDRLHLQPEPGYIRKRKRKKETAICLCLECNVLSCPYHGKECPYV